MDWTQLDLKICLKPRLWGQLLSPRIEILWQTRPFQVGRFHASVIGALARRRSLTCKAAVLARDQGVELQSFAFGGRVALKRVPRSVCIAFNACIHRRQRCLRSAGNLGKRDIAKGTLFQQPRRSIQAKLFRLLRLCEAGTTYLDSASALSERVIHHSEQTVTVIPLLYRTRWDT